ncbi:glycosyltransferase [Flavobacterium psychrolimnae]|uniref:Glycosyltransferase n=1 Tax=Flavobacterium psychrolimnae TaxID=249351 RepID=A0A366B005_9FLAO|nr:glycosyltransferase [Flavobacterium psychrolimnae]RBN49497.1 glycosyltransferase [Flavobacterium psychrolimnae]
MKILQIINSLGTGGAEKLLLDTIPLYRKAGIDMDVLVFWNNNHQFIKALKALDCCKVIVLKESDNYKDIYALSHIWKLRPYLKQYDVVHVHLFPAQYYTVVAKILGGSDCKLIFTEHSVSNRRIEGSFLYRFFDRLIYRKFSVVVAITIQVADIVRNHTLINKNKIKVILNGVSIEKIKDSKPYFKTVFFETDSTNDKLIIQVSSFREPKDHATLLKALKLLPSEVKLILVGDGVLKKECEELTEALGLQGRVLFLGQRMDIPQLLKTADIVVLSSKYEGLSLSSIEGMASGKPFVASDVPGLSDIVAGVGVLFECGNAKELATRIERLLDDKMYYDSVVRACQEKSKQYDIQVMIQKHIDLYKIVALQ